VGNGGKRREIPGPGLATFLDTNTLDLLMDTIYNRNMKSYLINCGLIILGFLLGFFIAAFRYRKIIKNLIHNHYLDSAAASGGDGSIETPWNTIEDMCKHPFRVDDFVYIKCGSTFSEPLIIPPMCQNLDTYE